MFFKSLRYLVSTNNVFELKVDSDIPSRTNKNRPQKQTEEPQIFLSHRVTAECNLTS